MLIKLFFVSVTLKVWNLALRLSDKLSSEKWLAISFVNILLILALLICPLRTNNLRVSENPSRKLDEIRNADGMHNIALSDWRSSSKFIEVMTDASNSGHRSVDYVSSDSARSVALPLKAIMVGVSEYKDSSPSHFAAADTIQIATAFTSLSNSGIRLNNGEIKGLDSENLNGKLDKIRNGSSSSIITRQIIRQNLLEFESQKHNSPVYFFYAGHGAVDSASSDPVRSVGSMPKVINFASIVGVNEYRDSSPLHFASLDATINPNTLLLLSNDGVTRHQSGHISAVENLTTDSNFLQNSTFQNFLKRFLPNLSYRANAVQNETGFFREAVFYVPLALFVINFFTLLLTFISLRRKWAEAVQLQLSIEKLRLEVEILKEERDKDKPKIIIVSG